MQAHSTKLMLSNRYSGTLCWISDSQFSFSIQIEIEVCSCIGRPEKMSVVAPTS